MVVEKKKAKGERAALAGQVLSWVKKFIPVFLLFMLLPFFVAFVINPPEIRFFTGAGGEENRLRVWIEPSSVVVNAGGGVELTIMADFESDEKLISGLKVGVAAPGGVSLSSMSVVADKPFRGQMMIGTVQATALKSGTYEVKIPKELVEAEVTSGPLEIIVGSANLVAQ